MRHKSIPYYFRTILLKLKALRYRLSENSSQRKKEVAQFSAELDKSTDQIKIDSNFHNFYYTYTHFSEPKELASSLLFNENDVAFSSIGSPYANHVNPIFPAYYGLVCYNHYLKTQDEKSLKSFNKQVDFLLQHGEWKNECFLLNYPFDLKNYNLKAPWIAGITQALSASLLMRATRLNPNIEFDKTIDGLINSLFLPVEEGGVYIEENGMPWMEEYPAEDPSYVLNGFIFCIIAIAEYSTFPGKEKYATDAKRLIASLLKHLPKFKYGNLVRHNLKHWQLSNLEYQGLYVFQFLHLYKLTGSEIFKSLSNEFNSAFKWEHFYEFYGVADKTIDLNKHF